MQRATITYVKDVSKDMEQQVSHAQFITNLIDDRRSAITLLENDPITGKHSTDYYESANVDGFLNNRVQRLNYYAAKALLARVYMLEGSASSKNSAYTEAMDVISGANLSWATDSSVNNDFVMTSEHLFGLNVSDLMTRTSDYIKLDYAATDYLTFNIDMTKADDMYESTTVGSSDFRYTKLLSFSPGNMTYQPKKIYQPSSSYTYKDIMPLIRISEMYYIAAEARATTNLSEATTLLDEVRTARGITSALSVATIDDFNEELTKEYRKEFLSEGVLFYYYKRTGVDEYDGYFDASSNPMVIGDAQYLLPYPELEIQYGRVQYCYT